MNDYQLVKELIDAEKINEAMPILVGMLEENPDDAVALNFRGYVHLLLDDDATAYQFFKRSADISPNVTVARSVRCFTCSGAMTATLHKFRIWWPVLTDARCGGLCLTPTGSRLSGLR